jgi:hypothetical protein
MRGQHVTHGKNGRWPVMTAQQFAGFVESRLVATLDLLTHDRLVACFLACSRLRYGLRDRLDEALPPVGVGRHPWLAAENGEPAMAELEQMLGCNSAAGHVVGATEVGSCVRQLSVYGHQRHAPLPDLLEIVVWHRLIRWPEDDPIDPLIEQAVQAASSAASGVASPPVRLKCITGRLPAATSSSWIPSIRSHR